MKLGLNESYLVVFPLSSGHLSGWKIGCIGPFRLGFVGDSTSSKSSAPAIAPSICIHGFGQKGIKEI